MKKLFYVLLAGFLCQLSTFAQTINYQGVARNAQGTPLANAPIAVRLSIRDAASGGNTFYSETKNATTNGFGLYAISINDGSGSRTGSFGNINWSQPTYIQTEIDPANGTAFTGLGTSLMQSVPSAIVADNLKGVSAPQEGDMLVFRNNQWQKKPAKEFYSETGLGFDPTTTLGILTTPVVVDLINSTQILRITALRVFGTVAQGGATGLNLGLGYRRVDITNQPFNLFVADSWETGIRMPIGTRDVINFSGTYQTSLPPGRYEIGIIGRTTSDASTAAWNANGRGTVTIEVEY